MAGNGSIDQQNKHGKVDKETNIRRTNKTTTRLLEVSAKTVQQDGHTWDVKDIPNKDAFSIEGEDSSATPKDRDVSIVPHADGQV
jgi:hypothetical protein